MDSSMYPQGSGGLKSRYVDGVLVFSNSSGGEVYRIDPSSKLVTFQSIAVSSAGKTYYVDPQNGASTNDGLSWTKAFAAFSSLDSILGHGDTIMFRGAFKGNWSAPYKNDITLIGCANTPRQATDGGVSNGAGATWLSADSPVAAPLLSIRKQAWRVENIFFNNADTAYPCVYLLRDNETPEADASHALIQGCVFTGTDNGILMSGGNNFVRILGNVFRDFAGSGDIALTTAVGAGAGSAVQCEIGYNLFHGNVHNIIVGLGAGSRIHHNFLCVVGNTVTSTSVVNLTGSTSVTVDNNVIPRTSVTAGNDTLFVDGTTCLWVANQMANEVRYLKPDES